MNPILINECHEVTRRFVRKYPRISYMDFFQELQVRIIKKQKNGKYVAKELLEIFAKDVLRHTDLQRMASLEVATHFSYSPWEIVDRVIDIEKSHGFGTTRAIQLGINDKSLKKRVRRGSYANA